MLIVETIGKIRRYHFVDGKGIREISRLLGVSRNTVRKVVRSDATEHRYVRTRQPMPRLGAWVSRLEELLEEDSKRPHKRRITARRYMSCFRKRVTRAAMTAFSVSAGNGGRSMGVSDPEGMFP